MTARTRRWFQWSLRTLFVVGAVALCSLGCPQKPPANIPVPAAERESHQDAAKPIGREEAEAKAVDHLLKTTQFRKHQLRVEAFPDGTVWTVYVFYVPATPDFMWTLKVSANGEVTEQ